MVMIIRNSIVMSKHLQFQQTNFSKSKLCPKRTSNYFVTIKNYIQYNSVCYYESNMDTCCKMSIGRVCQLLSGSSRSFRNISPAVFWIVTIISNILLFTHTVLHLLYRRDPGPVISSKMILLLRDIKLHGSTNFVSNGSNQPRNHHFKTLCVLQRSASCSVEGSWPQFLPWPPAAFSPCR